MPVLAQGDTISLPEALTPTIPPVDNGDGTSEGELLDVIKGVIAALVVVIVSLVWLARTLGLKVADSIPGAIMPLLNVGQRAAELLTPFDDWDDNKIKEIAESIGAVATKTGSGQIIWTPKSAALSIDPTVARMQSIEQARALLSSEGWNLIPPAGHSPTWLDEDTNG